MTKYNVTDNQCLKVRRQVDDLVRRVEQGTIPFLETKESLQLLIQNKRLVLVKPSWTEKDGIIYFSVTSDGTTGSKWIKRLEDKGFRISDYAKQLLNSKEFKSTSGVTTGIAVLRGELFSDSDRITKKIRAYAKKQKLTTPNVEIACLIREQFTDKDIEAMGLNWIITMHESIKDSDGDPLLLGTDRRGGGRWLGAGWGEPGYGWGRGIGFAFAQSQVSST